MIMGGWSLTLTLNPYFVCKSKNNSTILYNVDMTKDNIHARIPKLG